VVVTEENGALGEVEIDTLLSDKTLEHYEQWLDAKFQLPGTRFRFGLDGIIGLIPVIGDLLTTGISALFVVDAIKSGARKHTIGRMLANVVVDLLIGLIPIVGDLFDFAFKSNTKNLNLLKTERAHLRARSLEKLKRK